MKLILIIHERKFIHMYKHAGMIVVSQVIRLASCNVENCSFLIAWNPVDRVIYKGGETLNACSVIVWLVESFLLEPHSVWCICFFIWISMESLRLIY